MLSIPATLDTEENACGGILVCLPAGLGPEKQPAFRSFFSDKAIDRGTTLSRFIDWFTLWGVPMQRVRGTDTAFERSFTTFEWPRSELTDAHGPQRVPRIAADIASLCAELQKRTPSLVIFLSCYSWQAINTPDALKALLPLIGKPLGPGRRITDARLGAFLQRWEKCTMLALPLPSKNTTDTYVTTLSQGVQQALRLAGKVPTETVDPLLSRAPDALVLDEAASLKQMKSLLHVSDAHAQRLWKALEGHLYTRDAAGRPRLTLPR